MLLLCAGFLDSIDALVLEIIGIRRFGEMGLEFLGKKMDTFGNLEDLRGWRSKEEERRGLLQALVMEGLEGKTKG